MTENLKIWNALKRPPEDALKKITGGRLSGKTDISPQWRYQAMTEQFGPCGIGWKWDIVKLWTEPAPDNQVFAFAQVNVFISISVDDNTWRGPIPGIGGSMLVEKEKSGLHANDEAFKMAVTDALSVALKMLGVAADIYAGLWDGSKYRDGNGAGKGKQSPPPDKPPEKPALASEAHRTAMWAQRASSGWSKAEARDWLEQTYPPASCHPQAQSQRSPGCPWASPS